MVANYVGGGLLHRRNMMNEQTAEGTVYKWDYTMGLPEDIGWTRYSSAGTETVTLEDNGMRLLIEDTSIVRWKPPVETCLSGYAEIVFIPVSFVRNGQGMNARGIQLQVSNGTSGLKTVSRMIQSNASYIQCRQVGSSYSIVVLGYDGPCFLPNVLNYQKIGNNINGKTIVTIPRSGTTDKMNDLVTYTYDGYDKSSSTYSAMHRNQYNAFGLADAGEVIFVSAKFTIYE